MYLFLFSMAVVVYGDCCYWMFLGLVLIHYSSRSKVIILSYTFSALFYLHIWHFCSALALYLNMKRDLKCSAIKNSGDKCSIFNLKNCLYGLIRWGARRDQVSMWKQPLPLPYQHTAKPSTWPHHGNRQDPAKARKCFGSQVWKKLVKNSLLMFVFLAVVVVLFVVVWLVGSFDLFF